MSSGHLPSAAGSIRTIIIDNLSSDKNAGILISEQSGGLYVEGVEPGSAAARSGVLQPGDLLLEANGLSLLNLDASAAAAIFSRAGSLELRVLLRATHNEQVVPVAPFESHSSSGWRAFAGHETEHVASKRDLNMPSPHPVLHRGSATDVRRIHESARATSTPGASPLVIELCKGPQGLGFTVVGDEDTGIFVNSISPQGAAYDSDLRRGDRLLAVNDVPLTDIDIHTAVDIIKRTQFGPVVLLVVREFDPDGVRAIEYPQLHGDELLQHEQHAALGARSASYTSPHHLGSTFLHASDHAAVHARSPSPFLGLRSASYHNPSQHHSQRQISGLEDQRFLDQQAGARYLESRSASYREEFGQRPTSASFLNSQTEIGYVSSTSPYIHHRSFSAYDHSYSLGISHARANSSAMENELLRTRSYVDPVRAQSMRAQVSGGGSTSLRSQSYIERDPSMYAASRVDSFIIPLQGNDRLGLILGGGKMHGASVTPVVVANIVVGSPLDNFGHVEPGDRLVAINGQALDGVALSEAYNILQQAEESGSAAVHIDIVAATNLSSSQSYRRPRSRGMADYGYPPTAPSPLPSVVSLSKAREMQLRQSRPSKAHRWRHSPSSASGTRPQSRFVSDVILSNIQKLTLGIEVEPSRDPQYRGVQIARVIPGTSAALDGRIQPGMQLLAVGSTSMVGLTVQAASSVLAGVTDPVVRLLLASRSARSLASAAEKAAQQKHSLAQQTRTIFLDADDEAGGIGLIVGGGDTAGQGVYVNFLLKGGAADRDGRLRPGDLLLQIGDISLEGVSYTTAMTALMRAGLSVQITFQHAALDPHLTAATASSPLCTIEINSDEHGLGIILAANASQSSSQTAPAGPASASGGFPLGGYFIGELEADGAAAHDARLRVGDCLFEVNGMPMATLSLKTATLLLSQRPVRFTITFRPAPTVVPSAARDVRAANTTTTSQHPVGRESSTASLGSIAPPPARRVILERSGNTGSLGIRATDKLPGVAHTGVFIDSVIPGGAASGSEAINAGDQIIAVDGQSILGCSYQEGVEFLKCSGRSVELLVRATTFNGSKTSNAPHDSMRMPLPPSIKSSFATPTTPMPRVTVDARSALLAQLPPPPPVSQAKTGSSPQATASPSRQQVPELEENAASGEGKAPNHVMHPQEAIAIGMGLGAPGVASSPPAPVLRRVIHRDARGLGFGIRGGTDMRGGGLIRVGSVAAAGPAAGLLEVGDELLVVNKQPMLNVKHDEAVALLRGARSLDMLIQRHRSAGDSAHCQLKLARFKRDGPALGISIYGGNNSVWPGIFVRSVRANCAAAREGGVAANDHILAANGEPLLDATQSEAVEILRNLPSTIELLIRQTGSQDVHRRHVALRQASMEIAQQDRATSAQPLVNPPGLRSEQQLRPVPVVPKDLSPSADSHPAPQDSGPVPPRRLSSQTAFHPQILRRDDDVSTTNDDVAPPATQSHDARMKSPVDGEAYLTHAKSIPDHEYRTVELRKGPTGLGLLVVSASKYRAGRSDCTVRGAVVQGLAPGGEAEKDGRLKCGDEILAVGETSLVNMDQETIVKVLKSPPTGSIVRLTVCAKNANNESADGNPNGGVNSMRSSASTQGKPTRMLVDVEGGGNDAAEESLGMHAMRPRLSTFGFELPSPAPPGKSNEHTPSLKEAAHVQKHSPVTFSEGEVVILPRSELGSLGIGIEGGVDSFRTGIFVKELLKGGAAEINGSLKAGDEILAVNSTPVRGLTLVEAGLLLKTAPSPVRISYRPQSGSGLSSFQ